MCFLRMDSAGLYGDFHSRLTEVTIDLSAAKQPGVALMSMRLCYFLVIQLDEDGVLEKDDVS